MSQIPPELIATILSSLPVNPLLRFRSISKHWRELIDSPAFINLHLKHSIQTYSHRTIIFKSNHLYTSNLDSLQNPTQLDHPFKHAETQVLGSCNGLLCLLNPDGEIALWNPSTRTHHVLPYTDAKFRTPKSLCLIDSLYILYGFGYDHVNDDYKVVRMMQVFSFESIGSFDSDVKVYSLKTDSWRRINDFPYAFRRLGDHGVFADGVLHWVVSRRADLSDSDNLIGALDLETGESRLVSHPEHLDTKIDIKLGVLGGCLCVMGNFYRQCIDIWVMKEYGVRESWTKLLSVSQPHVPLSHKVALPLTYSKSGQKVLLEKGHRMFVWHDLKSNKVKNVRVNGLELFSGSIVCVESLVKLHDGGGGTNGKNLQF